MAYARCYSDTPEPHNANQVCVQGIPHTDFPLDEIKLWLVKGTLMLPRNRTSIADEAHDRHGLDCLLGDNEHIATDEERSYGPHHNKNRT